MPKDELICPYGGDKIHLCSNETCDVCFNRSFASDPKANQWSKLNKKTARQTLKRSNNKYWLYCDKCKHDYDKKSYTIGTSGCPYCRPNSGKFCTNKSCESCYKKSFDSHPYAIYWSYKNGISPRMIGINSCKKCWFDCDKCKQSFEATPGDLIKTELKCHVCDSDNRQTRTRTYTYSFLKSKNAKYWSVFNKKLPEEVPFHSTAFAYFECSCGKLFIERIKNISKKKCNNKCLCRGI